MTNDGVDAALDCGARLRRAELSILSADRVVTVSDFEAGALGVRLATGDPHALFADSFEPVLPSPQTADFATEIAAEFPMTELAAAQDMSQKGHLLDLPQGGAGARQDPASRS